MTAEAIPGSSSPTRAEQLGTALRQALPRGRDFLVNAFGQVRILQKAYPGVMHLLIFWGVTIQVIGTATVSYTHLTLPTTPYV
jgi:hypothetical protein